MTITTTQLKQLSDGNPQGTQMGQSSSDPIGFYGKTPIARTAFSTAAIATTAAVSTTSNKWGFSTSTQANAIVSLVNEIRAWAVLIGLKA